MLADLRRFNRALGAPARRERDARRGRSLATLIAERRLLALVRRAPDRPPGLGRVVGRPARRCGASRRASSPSSSTTTACSASAAGPRWRWSPGARSATWRRSAGRSRERVRLATAGDARSAATRTSVTVRLDGERAGALRRGGPRLPRRPGARAAGGPRAEREREILGVLPLPAQRGRAAHRLARCSPAAPRARQAWNYHLLAEPRPPTTVTYYMNHLQRLDAPEDFCVTLNMSRGDRPGAVIRQLHYAHPVFTTAGVAAQARRREISGRAADPLLRCLLGLGLPRGRRRLALRSVGGL